MNFNLLVLVCKCHKVTYKTVRLIACTEAHWLVQVCGWNWGQKTSVSVSEWAVPNNRSYSSSCWHLNAFYLNVHYLQKPCFNCALKPALCLWEWKEENATDLLLVVILPRRKLWADKHRHQVLPFLLEVTFGLEQLKCSLFKCRMCSGFRLCS